MVALDESRGESVEKQEAVVDGAVPGKPAPETGHRARAGGVAAKERIP